MNLVSQKKQSQMKFLLRYSFFVFILALISMYFYHCRYLRYSEYRHLKKELYKVKGIEVIDVWVNDRYYDEPVDYICTKILVNNDVEIELSLESYDFEKPSGLEIAIFGEWRFSSFGCKNGKAYVTNPYNHGSISLNNNSLLVNRFDLDVNNIKEIANKYKSIEKIVESIPEFPNMAMFEEIDIDGKTSTKVFYKYKVGSNVPQVNFKTCDSLMMSSIENWNL